MNPRIRKAEHRDAEGIIQVHIDSIRGICSKDYTSQEIESWATLKFRPEVWQRRMDRDELWVVEDSGCILGFAHFAVMTETEGEVMGLYLSPSIKCKGFGKKLFFEIEKLSRKLQLKKINLLSTKTAKSFYEDLGFRQTSGDTTIDFQDVPITCHPMTLELNISHGIRKD